jgi:hypothetical protein
MDRDEIWRANENKIDPDQARPGYSIPEYPPRSAMGLPLYHTYTPSYQSPMPFREGPRKAERDEDGNPTYSCTWDGQFLS